MLRTFFETMVGKWGMAFINFYDAHSFLFNSLLLAYGIFLVLSWVNLKNVHNLLIRAMVDELRNRFGAAADAPTAKDLKSVTIPWESAVRQVRFPFVARQTDLLPHRLSADAVKAMIPVEHLNKVALAAFQQQQKRAART